MWKYEGSTDVRLSFCESALSQLFFFGYIFKIKSSGAAIVSENVAESRAWRFSIEIIKYGL